MNHVFRLVWNSALRAFVPAAEWARGRGKSGRTSKTRALLTTAALLSGTHAALAGAGVNPTNVNPTSTTLPAGAQVTAGAATVSSLGNTLTVSQGTEKTAIDWQSFSIGSKATVDFVQPNSSAIVLNRVVGNEESVISGALHANGQVFLLNSDGVLFAKSARVDTGGLVASTLNLSDADFLTGKNTFVANGKNAALINLGSLTTKDGGYVALLGSEVKNGGLIGARLGAAVLAAGDKVSLNFNGNSLLGVTIDKGALHALVENSQAIVADGGTVILTAKGLDSLLAGVVNNTGEIRAQTIANHDGKIFLLGDMQADSVNVAGTLDATAPDGGNGGRIETSAANVSVNADAHISTAAARGTTGNWVIDPVDFTIAASGGDITGATLSSELAGTNVSLSSVNGAHGTLGNLNVNDTVTWNAHTLTLTAVNDVDVNAVMTATGTASLNMEPGSGNVNVALTASGFTGAVNFSGTGALTMNNHVYTVINSLGTASSSNDGTLQGMQGNPAGHYALGSNIDASATAAWNSGAGFTAVGSNPSFSGTFDGLGHTVSGLTMNTSSYSGTGLFAITSGSSSAPVFVRNVALTNVSLTCEQNCGALVGYGGYFTTISNVSVSGALSGAELEDAGLVAGYLESYNSSGPVYDSKITNAYVSGTIFANEPEYVGGIVGEVYGVNLSGIHSSVVMTFAPGNYEDGEYIGGLIGAVDYGSVDNATFTGTINLQSSATGSSNHADYEGVGGLVGEFGSQDALSNSHSTGSIIGTCPDHACFSGDEYIGGLVGESEGLITASYATGTISLEKDGEENIGGLVGDAAFYPISHSYSSVVISVPGSLARNVGGLVGDFDDTTVTNSYATGSITVGPNAQFIAGFVGYANDTNAISTSYATGAVTAGIAAGQLGGFGGYMDRTTMSNVYSTGAVTAGAGSSVISSFLGEAGGLVTIDNSYASGAVSPGAGTTHVGGLLAQDDSGNTVTGSFWDTTSTGLSTSVRGVGMTTAQMQQEVDFTTATVANGNVNPAWDFGATWVVYNGNTYPLLQAFMTPLTATANAAKTYDGTAADTVSYSVTPDMSHLFGTPVLTGAGTNAGTYTVGLSGLYSDQQGYIISSPSTTVTVSPRPVTVAAVNGASEVYGGTTAAAANLLAITNVVTGDTVALSGTATLSGSNAGTESVASLSGLSLNNSNYTLVNGVPSGSVTITPRPVAVAAVNGASEVYNGTTIAPASLLTITNVVTGDTVTLSGTATMAGRNVGNENLVSLGGLTLSNSNYTLSGGVPSGSVAITARPVAVAAVNGASEVYNGTNAAPANLLTITNVVTGDAVTLSGMATVAGSNVGTENLVSLSGLTLNNSNYTLTGSVPSGSVAITPRIVAVAAVNGASEVYNGTTTAPENLLTITNVLTGDAVTLSGTATLAGSAVGTENVVSLNGLALSNPNYTLTGGVPSGSVNITPRPVSVVVANGAYEVYDGTTAAPATLLTLTNVVTGDAVTLSGTATLAGVTVGTEDVVSLSGLAINNPNYALSSTPSGSILVSPRPVAVTAVGGANEAYSGTTAVPASLLTVTNVLPGDAVTLSGAATLAGSAVGSERIVGLTGLMLSNPDYTVTGAIPSGSVLITPIPSDANSTVNFYDPGLYVSNAIAVADKTAPGQPAVDSARASIAPAPNVLEIPASLTTTFGNDARLAVVTTPSGNESTAVVTLSQARQMMTGKPSSGANGSSVGITDVRIPVSRNSLAQIVNGGVKLPNGVEQQLFVVKAN